MALLNIKEYLNNKGKTIEKPSDILNQKMDKAPDAPKKAADKTCKFPAELQSAPLPYKLNKKELKVKDSEGLGDIGTPGVDFSAKSKDVDSVTQLKEHCGCEKKKAPFVVAYSSGAYHPDPIQAIKYIVYLTNENDNILKALMHEAKKKGCINKYANWISKNFRPEQVEGEPTI